MEGQKKGFFALRVRWGFGLILFIILIGVSITVMLVSMHWLFLDNMGEIAPTRYMADQVGSELLHDLSEEIMGPSEIYRWRKQGEWDAKPEFSKSALFWFTYNSTDHSFTIYPTGEQRDVSPALLEHLKTKIAANIDSTLTIRQAGGIRGHLKDEVGDFRLQGMLYEDEPKGVGLIQDLDRFRQIVLPEVLENARQNYPLLNLFTEVPEGNVVHPSRMFILFRDRQDSIIAQLGEPGEYAYKKELDRNDYRKEYPLWQYMGIKPEIIIPNCSDLGFEKLLRRAFYSLIAYILLLIFVWSRAQVRLSRARKQLESQ